MKVKGETMPRTCHDCLPGDGCGEKPVNLSDLCRRIKISTSRDIRKPWDQLDDWQRQAKQYRVTLEYKGRRMFLDFFMGQGNKKGPDAAGVMSCLLSDSTAIDQTFEDWCADMGYDEDSRKAEKIYQECRKSGAKLKNFLREDYETFLYAENDV